MPEAAETAETARARRLDRLRRWLEGERADASARDLLVEPGADASAVRSLALGEGAYVFVEEGGAALLDVPGVRVVEYSGVLELVGGEISLGDGMLVQTESYATAPYVSLSLPTALSVVDDVDREALLADVTTTENTSLLPPQLLQPVTTLVDQARLLAPLGLRSSTANRLHLRADGILTQGPADETPLGDDFTIPTTGEVTVDEVRIARFVGAAKVVRGLRARLDHDVRLVESARGSVPRRDPVFVLAAADDTYVVDALSGALSRVPAEIGARVTAALAAIADGESIDDSTRRVFDVLGLAPLLTRPREAVT
ncbi:hypothetical protein [Microbacterium stercoris]|uniref:Uncharacterized protein n=1 Tax=Microbacterium stercoris TaxID=2820289 RepID=A0A939TMX9_9MICO|nr:hypothetical protein [Microbacterium stercoris]MBO3663643.1 hypothetical protein [Microbacterium stercoris]